MGLSPAKRGDEGAYCSSGAPGQSGNIGVTHLNDQSTLGFSTPPYPLLLHRRGH